MSARSLSLALALTLAACGPTTAPAPEAPLPAPIAAPTNPDAVALTGATADGQWFFQGDAGLVSAGFGVPQSEFQLAIICEAPSGRVTIGYAAEAPPGAAELRLITATETLVLNAQSTSEGLPDVRAIIDGAQLASLAAPQERFAVSVADQTTIFPWDEAVERALRSCA